MNIWRRKLWLKFRDHINDCQNQLEVLKHLHDEASAEKDNKTSKNNYQTSFLSQNTFVLKTNRDS